MEKLKKYSFSIIIIGLLLSACHPVKGQQEDPVAEKERLTKKLEKYFQCSRYEQETRDRLIELDPFNAEMYRHKSTAHTKAGDYHIAFPLLEKATELNKSETLYYYSWLLLRNFHDYERALQRLNEYDDLTPGKPDYAWSENVNFLKGLAYKQMGQYDKALVEFEQYIADAGGPDKTDVFVHYYKGISNAKLNNNQEAIRNFDTTIKYYENCSEAWYQRGVTLVESGQKEAGIKSMLKAKELLAKGYRQIDPYHEIFDAVSLEMVEDKLIELSELKSSK